MEFAKSATSGAAVNKRFASFYAMQQFWEAATFLYPGYPIKQDEAQRET